MIRLSDQDMLTVCLVVSVGVIAVVILKEAKPTHDFICAEQKTLYGTIDLDVERIIKFFIIGGSTSLKIT